MRNGRGLVFLVLPLLIVSQAQTVGAQLTPIGGQFIVNQITIEDQFNPVIASDGASSFLIAWESDYSADASCGIAARWLDDSGLVGTDAEIAVNVGSVGCATEPSMAMVSMDHAVIAWQERETNDSFGLHARQLTRSAGLVGSRYYVDSVYYLVSGSSQTSMDGSGRIMHWYGERYITDRLYDNDIDPADPTSIPTFLGVTAAVFTLPSSWHPIQVAAGPTGLTLVALSHEREWPVGPRLISARFIDGDGVPLSDVFQPSDNSDYSYIYQQTVCVAMNGNSESAIVWFEDGKMRVQRYNALGTPIGDIFPGSLVNDLNFTQCEVTMNLAGDLIITYENYYSSLVLAQVVLADNTVAGDPIQIADMYDGKGYSPDIAMTESGRVIVAWVTGRTKDADGDGAAIAARVFDLQIPAVLEFVSADVSVNEDGGSALIHVHRHGSFADAVNLDYTTFEGDALPGLDYSSTTGTLQWLAGDNSTKTISIPIIDDSDLEGDETFTVTLTAPLGGALLGTNRTTTVTITDDESSYVHFVQDNITVVEGGQAILEVERLGSTSMSIEVEASTDGETAIADEDYVPQWPTLSWGIGDVTNKTITVPILDDTVNESSETFGVVLRRPSEGAEITEPSRATVTILDDDLGSIAMAIGNLRVPENTGTVRLNVLRVGNLAGAVSVQYRTNPGTATEAVDYDPATGTLSWADLDGAPRWINVPILDDAELESDEDFEVELFNPQGGEGTILASPSTTTITIGDNDSCTVKFNVSSIEVEEDGGSIDLVVVRSGFCFGEISVRYDVINGSATPGADFQLNEGTLVWQEGDPDERSVTVTVYDDALTEGSETIEVALFGLNGDASIAPPNKCTVSILDNELAEIPVNITTLSEQTRPSVGVDAVGNVVVVWDSYLQDGSGWGVVGRLFAADGTPRSGEFLVPGTLTGDQRDPVVAMASDGRFVVAWRSDGLDGSGWGVYTRTFSSDGTSTSDEILVNQTIFGDQIEATVAIHDSGAFMVAWSGDGDVFGRAFAASGAALGSEQRLNSTTADIQNIPAVSPLSGGGYQAVWQSMGQDGPALGIVSRRVNLVGAPLGSEMIVNQFTSGHQSEPSLACNDDSSCFVAWEDSGNRDGDGGSVWGRRLSSSGAPEGSERRLNDFWHYDQSAPAVAVDGDGRLIALWESDQQDGSGTGVFMQLYDALGNVSGPEIQANTYTFGSQRMPSVAFSASGLVALVWASGGQDTSGDGIFGVITELGLDETIFSDGFENGSAENWSLTTD